MKAKWTDRNPITRWMLDYALRRHMADSRRTEVGPAHTSFIGWLYFRVLSGIRT